MFTEIRQSQETVAPRAHEVRIISHELITDEKGRVFERRLVDVADEADPNEVEKMRRLGDAWEEELLQHPSWSPPKPDPLVPGKLFISQKNSAAQWLYRDWDSSNNEGSMELWASTLFPTARALYPLQRVADGGRVLPGGVIDERAQYLFTHMVDGIGLRSRARVYAEQLVTIAKESPEQELTVVSLGCGAGVPNIDATERIERELGKAVDWDLYDFDTESLRFAKELVGESAVLHSSFRYGDPYDQNTVVARAYARAFALPEASVDVVDALGLWEYIPQKHAVRFAERAYRLVKPGGRLIVSNMLPSRPQREFNQRAVGWPGLQLRSEDDLLAILDEAGIDSRNVTMTHATDGVYVVMEIRK